MNVQISPPSPLTLLPIPTNPTRQSTLSTMELLLFFSFFLCSSLAYFIFLHFSQFTLRKRLPPGTLGLPLIGETLRFISAYRTENPEVFIDERVEQYGSTVFTSHLYGEPTVISADPEVNQFVLKNEGKLFESSYPSSILRLLGKHSLVFLKDGFHREMHSIAMGLSNQTTIRDNFLVDIDRLVRLDLDSWTNHIFLQDQVKKITFGLTIKQLISVDPGQWTENLRKEYIRLADGFFGVPLPLFFTRFSKAIKARTEVTDALIPIVRERRKEFELKNIERKKDILEAVFEKGAEISDEGIVDFLVALLTAGYDTVSYAMTSTVKFLTENPLAFAQLKQEHDGIRANKKVNEALEWKDYKLMSFTQCVINETLRVANAVPGVFRRAKTDVNIKEFTIPRGWKVYTSLRAVHLHHDYHKEARTFNPWRWQDKANGSASASTAARQGNTYTPFGGGQRLCAAYDLARVEMSVFLHYLVTTYSWEPAEMDKVISFPIPHTLKRYPINVTRRRQSSLVEK